jgi:hypothetical protein
LKIKLDEPQYIQPAARMNIIQELIQDLTSSTTNIESALLKAQVLAHQLEDSDLKLWVDNELRGYGKEVTLPDYRITKITLIGDVSNGYWRHSGRTLPVFHLDEKIRNKLTTREVRESISAVTEMANPEKNYSVSIQPEYFHLISEKFETGYFVESARGIHSAGAMAQIITQVKSRLLDFVLALSDKISNETSPSEFKEMAGAIDVKNMFNNAIFGSNTTIIVGNSNSQLVSNEIKKNDVESLLNFLRKNSVGEEDIGDLREALSIDNNEISSKEKPPGKHVQGWMHKMITKAGTASWQISAEAAGNLLAAAIGAFYGLTS